MKKITKNQPPKEFLEAVNIMDEEIKAGYIAKKDRYKELRKEGKDELRASLAEEQGFICAYCERSLLRNEGGKRSLKSVSNLKIEHFKPDSIYNGIDEKPDLRLSYDNLLLACSGDILREEAKVNQVNKRDKVKVKKDKGHRLHCDSSKSNIELFYLKNPASWTAIDEQKIEFTVDGRITSSDANILLELQGNRVGQHLKKPYNLNLNQYKLVDSRVETWDGVIELINQKYEKVTGDTITYDTWSKGGKTLIKIARFYKKKYEQGVLMKEMDNKVRFLDYRSSVLAMFYFRFKGRL